MPSPFAMLPLGLIKRLVDGAIIPPDPGNKDYAGFQQWMEAGNMPDVEPAPVLLDPVDTIFKGGMPWQS